MCFPFFGVCVSVLYVSSLQQTTTPKKEPPVADNYAFSKESEAVKMSKGPDMNINADMTKEMQDDAKNFVIAAFETETQERAIASFIKHEFQRKYKGTWHCICGKNFGSYVTHETKGYIYLTVGQVAVLLWKSVT